MRIIFFLPLFFMLSSCYLINESISQNRKRKCDTKCYEEYQANIQPCHGVLENAECKEPYEKIHKECLLECKGAKANADRMNKESSRETMNDVLYPNDPIRNPN